MADRMRLTVTAGVTPGGEIPEYTSVWTVTEEAINADAPKEGEPELVDRIIGEAMDYANGLMEPMSVDWVTLQWVWLRKDSD